MMVGVRGERRERGWALMETVVALGVIGMAVPVIVAAMGCALGTGRAAEEDTRAAMMARAVFGEVPLLWDGEGGELFEGRAAYPAFAERALLFGAEGDFRGAVPVGGDAAGRIETEGVHFVARVTGEGREVGGAGELSQVMVVIEAPAKLPEASRRRYRFVKLLAREGG